jgi:hypothetical protein
MKPISVFSTVVCILLMSAPVWGDTTMETTFKTGGVQGMGASEGTRIERYHGSKKYEVVDTKFTGAILSRLTSGNESITITRLDKSVYWELDPAKKTYRETPIAPLKLSEAPAQKGKEEKEMRVTKSEFSVKKTGNSESINGFPCTEYLLTWLLETEDVQTKAKSQLTMTTNLWTTPETATIRRAQAEVGDFDRALAKKLGVDMSPEEAKQMGMGALAAIGGVSDAELKQGLSKVRREMAKIQGYPIRTTVTWNQQGSEGGEASGEKGAGYSGASELLKGGGCLLPGLPGTGAKEGKQGGAVFSSTSEVKSINVDPVQASSFEIPSGYNQVK